MGGVVCTLIVGLLVDYFSYTPVFAAVGLMPLSAYYFVWRGKPVAPKEPEASKDAWANR